MQVALLAGGMATRLGDLAKTKPKSMIEIGGRPFLDYQLEFLRESGVTSLILCLGHLAEQIQRYFGDGRNFGVDIRYSVEDKPMGTAGALKKAAPLLDDEFFILYGDSYLFLDLRSVMQFFRSQHKLALMTVYRNFNNYDRSNCLVEDGLVTCYSKTARTPDMQYIDYGANLLCKEVLDLVPEEQFYSLESVIPHLVARREVLAWEVKKRFYEIGSVSGLREFTEYIEERK